MKINYLLEEEYWGKIEKTDILIVGENYTIYNLCVAKAKFAVENKEKLIWASDFKEKK